MISAVASVVAVGEPQDDEKQLEEKIDAVMDTLVDPAGTFYRFNMAHAMLGRVKV